MDEGLLSLQPLECLIDDVLIAHFVGVRKSSLSGISCTHTDSIKCQAGVNEILLF